MKVHHAHEVGLHHHLCVREHVDQWVTLREVAERIPCVPTAVLSHSNSLLPFWRCRTHGEPPFWFTPLQCLAFVTCDLQFADDCGLSLADTALRFPYIFRVSEAPCPMLLPGTLTAQTADRNARALKRSII